MYATEMHLLDAFPEGFTPNEAQKIIISQLAEALDDQQRFIIINAPTATGKSFISKMIANYSAQAPFGFTKAIDNGACHSGTKEIPDYKPFGAAILTVSKALQDQYVQFFSDGSVLKGKKNYICAKNEELDCEQGECFIHPQEKNDCRKCLMCPYYCAMSKAVKNRCAFYNYYMFDRLPKELKKKEFIICDEASELEDTIVEQYTFTIIPKDFQKVEIDIPLSPNVSGNTFTIERYRSWISKINQICKSIYKTLQNKIQKNKRLSKKEVAKYNVAKKYSDDTDSLLDAWKQTEYIIDRKDYGILFQPFNIDKLSYNIFDFAKTTILMSATIVDVVTFARTLGIPSYAYIEAPSSLDPEKAPIYIHNKFFLNKKNLEASLPSVCKEIDTILASAPNDKGIIHTHSMYITDSVKRYSHSVDRMLFREKQTSNEQLLETHRASKEPTVLVSPSMTHGIDLKGDEGKLQIIVKAPYAPLGDRRIKRKFYEDKAWYENRMLSTLVQASGRCNRSQEDESVTHILDGTVIRVIQNHLNTLPKYFTQRLKPWKQ